MIVDTSALLAVLNREPDAEHYQAAILAAASCRMSIANVLEASIVAEGRGGAEAGHELDAFLERAGIEPAPITTEHLAAARQAWRRFGKGNHPGPSHARFRWRFEFPVRGVAISTGFSLLVGVAMAA